MERRYRRVILLGVDGAGTFFSQADTPHMDQIFERGSVTNHAVTSFPSISAECWGSMLHGVMPKYHGLTNTVASSKRYDAKSEYPSVFRIIRENYPDAVLASFCNWSPINYGIIEDGIGVYQDVSGDEILTDKIVTYIGENDFDFIFVQFDSVDGAGHANGYGSENHLKQIAVVDSYIGRIYDMLKNRNMLDDTLVIVTSDHGGTPVGGHGGASDAEMYIFIGITGNNVIKGEMKSKNGVSVRDISAIVLCALGIECPDNFQGFVPDNLFEGYVQDKSRKYRCKPVYKEYIEPLFAEETSFDELVLAGKLRSIFHFDGNPVDTTARFNPVSGGSLTYTEGVIGMAADFSSGYVALDQYKFGLDSFSFAFWFKLMDENREAQVISNRNASVKCSAGFSFTTNSNGILFTYSDGETVGQHDFPYPEGFVGKWRHVIFTVRPTAQEIAVYYDFEKCDEQRFDYNFKSVGLDALKVCIGQDGTEKYPVSLHALIDEMLVFNGVLTNSDVDRLRKMYNK